MGPTAQSLPRQDGRSSLSVFGTIRTTFAQYRYLAASLPFDDGRQIKEAQPCYPLAGLCHQSGGHRKGSFERDTGSSCFWCRHHPSYCDQGKFHYLSRAGRPRLKTVRTRWPTTRIVWSLGYSAPMFAMRLGGERAERGQAVSASQCAMR